MDQGRDKLSIILPAHNEGTRITESLRKIVQKMESLSMPYEIIVVDDGSTDDTIAQARSYASKDINVLSYGKNRGKGYAIRQGMRNAQGEHRLFMDVDLSTSLDAIDQFLGIFKDQSFDIIIGNRKNNPSLQEVRQPLYRRFFGEGFTRLSSLMVGRPFTDFTCGFKMYNRKAADIIFQRQRIFNWAFDTELIYIAVLHRLKIFEAPVLWRHYEGSKVRVVRDIIGSLISLIKIRINAAKGLYQ